MRIDFKSRAGMALFAGGAVLMSSCALTTRPQPVKQFFLPPSRAMEAPSEPVLEPPAPPSAFYGNEVPAIPAPLAPMPRPTDAEFLIKKADDSFIEGKKALEAGNAADARKDFDHAVEALLSAPENLPDRSRVERRLDELIEAIYRYDADQASTGDSDKVVYDPRPMDGMVELTFTPADPGTRSKVLDLIHATASQLPLQQHDTVIGAVNYFTSERGKKIIAAGLRRQARYKPMIERVLAEEGVPQELLFLAQAESGYLPRAKSNKLCVGLWQFSKSTGHDYGLMQTASTDDRMDPEKSTRAAARYLKDLYTHFGDWYLAMAAYDCGPACVDHAVMRTGYADFFELRRLNVLPKETANYVPVILAMTIVGKNAPAYGLDHLDLETPLETDSIEMETPTHLALIADAIDRPLSELKELNPGLLKSVAPGGYKVHVPKGMLPAVETAFAMVPASKRDAWRLHRVSQGDSFAGLAKRYSAQTSLISQLNHDELPEPGSLVAIPAAYPGDRVAVAKTAGGKRRVAAPAVASALKQRKPVAKTASKTVSKKTASKTGASKTAAVAQKSSKAPVRHTAVLRAPNS
ncbi:MAG TPA: transglycosylase SLT domain-containing protein [Bryobacteraceae bacterium]|jgi:membrane-bound lytic murein transglycosylase D|nr:transglycosylase SLT domain-containing protein [Bryobacteraceae bacterium]